MVNAIDKQGGAPSSILSKVTFGGVMKAGVAALMAADAFAGADARPHHHHLTPGGAPVPGGGLPVLPSPGLTPSPTGTQLPGAASPVWGPTLAPNTAPSGALSPSDVTPPVLPDSYSPGGAPALAPAGAPVGVPAPIPAAAAAIQCPQDVWTQRYDNGRTGAILCEKQLNPQTVGGGNFGKVGSFAVDGQIYAQPLYLHDVALPSGVTTDVLIVATMQNTVFAFDAGKPGNLPLWQTSLGTPGNPSAIGINSGDDFGSALGILSTPVKDPNGNFLYVVSFNSVPSAEGNVYTHHLHAIDVRNGAENTAIQTRIDGSVRGNAPDAKNGIVSFNSVDQLQRPALAITDDGHIIVQFGSHDNVVPTHGWEIVYDKETLTQRGIYCSSPNDYGNSFWNGGTGPSIAANGIIYTSTATGFPNDFLANATAPVNNASVPTDRSNSVLRQKLTNGQIAVQDYYTPSNWAQLSLTDEDFGTAGVVVPPTGTRMFATNKAGVLYNIPRSNMGHVVSANDTSTQTLKVGNGPLYSTPVYFAGDRSTQIFTYGDPQQVKGYRYRGTTLSTTPSLRVNVTSIPDAAHNGMISLSANGRISESAILWAINYGTPEDGRTSADAVLNAIDVNNQRVVWSSAGNETRDGVGPMAKFIAPVVVDGRVYVANSGGSVQAYGMSLLD